MEMVLVFSNPEAAKSALPARKIRSAGDSLGLTGFGADAILIDRASFYCLDDPSPRVVPPLRDQIQPIFL
jgi:hypothetical protein